MKHHNKSFALLFLLLAQLAVVPSAWAQEFIKRVPLEKSRGMIIREVSVSSWLVYDIYSDGTKEINAFIMFTETGATAQVMQLPESFRQIYDFEIYDGRVYFAGENMNGVGIMGYFPVAGFPSPNIQLCQVPTMARFNKLEVGVFGQVLHVLMTGEGIQGDGHIVDARQVGGGTWNFAISNTIEAADVFDDVAVLTSKIVFSARKYVGQKGFLYFFSTSSVPYSILPQSPLSLRLGTGVSGRIMLDVRSGDDFFYVHRTSYNNDVVGSLNGFSLIQYLTLGSTFVASPSTTFDLTCGSVGGKAELLAYNNYSSSPWEILTANCLSGFSLLPPLLIYGHTFYDEHLNSLDAVGSCPDVYVAAGIATTENSWLSIYRYNRNYWPVSGCSDNISLECDYPSYKVMEGKDDFSGQNYIIEAVAKDCWPDEVPVLTKCIESVKTNNSQNQDRL